MPITDWDLIEFAEKYKMKSIVKSNLVIAFVPSGLNIQINKEGSIITIDHAQLFSSGSNDIVEVKSLMVSRPYVIINIGE